MAGIVFLATLITVGSTIVPQFFVRYNNWTSVAKWAVAGFLGNLFLNWLAVFVFTPGMTGPLGGYQFIWFTLLVNAIVAIVAYMVDNQSNNQLAAAIGSGSVLVLLLVILALIGIFTTWGDGNTKQLANYVHIEKVEGKMPETDTNHIVMVSPEVAKFKGGQVIASMGGNLGSIYTAGSYALQSVDKHLYWIAPLVYNNVFANWQYASTLGFIVVDAEDPNTQARMVSYQMNYVPGAWWDQDVVRHVYLEGYFNFRLVDPTIEVDDQWKPYFTIDASSYVRGLTGIDVKGLLVLDPGTGQVTSYNFDNIPTWVDRVIPSAGVQDYVDWWGNWKDAPWINFSGAGKQMSADDVPAIAYSRVDASPVWQFVMTSASTTDHSSTGVMLFDTKKNAAKLYPLTGVAVGSDVKHAFESNPGNIKGYAVDQLVLHNIYGEPTWIGTFVSQSSSGSGATYQAIGVLNANTVQGADVIMAASKEEAFRLYQQWLANRGSNEVDATTVNNLLEVKGVVDRFAPDIQKGTMFYFLVIKDQDGAIVNRIFYGTSLVNDKLPLTRVGDEVVIRYQDTNQRVVAIQDFNNLSLEVAPVNPEDGKPVLPAPTATPIPTLPPTPTPISLFESTPAK